MLAPKDLKVGDIFTDNYGISYKVTEIVPRVGYNAEIITNVNVKTPVEEKPIEEIEVSDELEEKSIKELQAMCKEKGLSIRGTKADIIKKLRSN